MEKIKIGFVPSTWESWDGSAYTGKWAGKMRARCLAVMNEIPGLEIVVPSEDMTDYGCVGTPEEGRKTMELFKREEVSAVMIGNMNFGHEVSLDPILTALPKDMPILHFATRSGEYSPMGNRATDTWCGQFMTCSNIRRHGFTFEHIITCNPEEPIFREKLEIFVRACMGVKKFKGARILQIGTRPTGFESEFYSEACLMKQFRQTIIPVDLATFYETYLDAVDPNSDEVKALAQEIRGYAVSVMEELPDSLINQARLEIALKKIAKDNDASALAVTCWETLQHKYHIAACSTFSRLNDQGIITACEVDVMGALTMLAMNACGLYQTPSDFIDWTDLHPTEKNVWLAWHCGNAAGSLCDPKSQIVLRANERLSIWGPTCHGTVEFKLKDGPVTCARMVEYDGKYSLFYGTGEVIDIPPLSRGTYGWVKVNDLEDWENKMVETGVVHHGVLIHDPKVADALTMFCKFMGINAVRGK